MPLQLIYIFSINTSNITKIRKRTPFINYITGDKIKQVEEYEIENNVLGKGQFIRVEDGDQSEEKSGNTNNYEDDSCYEFQDEEVHTIYFGINR